MGSGIGVSSDVQPTTLQDLGESSSEGQDIRRGVGAAQKVGEGVNISLDHRVCPAGFQPAIS